MKPLDRRLHAHRADLADARLRGVVEAERFAEGEPARVVVPVLNIHAVPQSSSGVDTQMLFGDMVRVFEHSDGWAWVQAERDGYVGYAEEAGLGIAAAGPSHVVAVPRSFVYPEAELKTPIVMAHSMGAGVAITQIIEKRGTQYALLASGGAMIARHLRPAEAATDDYAAVAETFLHTPYLWGGASGFGIDCSGLVQLSMRMAGRLVLRDTDMQADSIGTVIDPAETPLRRGDLVFWKGHVAIMLDGETMLHANGHSMSVAREPLAEAIERIAALYGRPTLYRRP